MEGERARGGPLPDPVPGAGNRTFLILDLIAWSGLGAVFLLGLGVLLLADARHWANLFSDDAFYYFAIAREIFIHQASQFAPPFSTNGYQPLWAGLCLAATYLAQGDLRGTCLIVYTLCFLAAALSGYLSWRFYGRAFPALLAAAAFPYTGLGGMEAALILPLVIALMRSRRWPVRGGLGALLFLARLDTLAMVAAAELVRAIRRRRIDPRPALIVAGVVAVYGLANQWRFGTPVPVSGLAKAVGNAPGENLLAVLADYGAAVSHPLMGAGLGLCLLFLAVKRSRLQFGGELAATALSLGVCILYYGLFSGWPVWEWYYWPIQAFTFYLLLEISGPGEQPFFAAGRWRIPRLAVAVIAMGLVAVPALSFARARLVALARVATSREPPPFWGSENVTLARWIHRTLPEGSFLAMGDRSGSLGYFLEGRYRLLQTEGLVASKDYIDALRRDEGLAFFNAQHVRYLIADRARYLETPLQFGVIEPIQGRSARSGPYLVCMRRDGVLFQSRYSLPRGPANVRLVFDLSKAAPCDPDLTRRFQALRGRFNGVRGFSVSN